MMPENFIEARVGEYMLIVRAASIVALQRMPARQIVHTTAGPIEVPSAAMFEQVERELRSMIITTGPD